MRQDCALDFYRAHDHFTEPGPHGAMLSTLPADTAPLLTAIDNVLIHVWKVKKHHPEWLQERPHDVFTRRIAPVLARIESVGGTDWTTSRPEERRAIVDCRTFALMLCAILRERGVPARVRCGFATYLEESHYMDHWVCEHWNSGEERWLRTDPDLQKEDVSPGEFFTGNEAWKRCRTDPDSARLFGFGPAATGLWAARYNLIRDFAALNGFVSVSGDGWKSANTKPAWVPDTEAAFLDTVAATMAEDVHFDDRRRLFETSEVIRPPDNLRHYDYLVAHKARHVAWRDQD